MVEFRSLLRYARIGPRKLRLVADQIRGRKVNDAYHVLRTSPKRGARMLKKLLDSAISNAEYVAAAKDLELDADELRVNELRVDEGPRMSRIRPRAMGRWVRIRKRFSHVSLVLIPEVAEEAAPQEGKPSKKKEPDSPKPPATQEK